MGWRHYIFQLSVHLCVHSCICTYIHMCICVRGEASSDWLAITFSLLSVYVFTLQVYNISWFCVFEMDFGCLLYPLNH